MLLSLKAFIFSLENICLFVPRGASCSFDSRSRDVSISRRILRQLKVAARSFSRGLSRAFRRSRVKHARERMSGVSNGVTADRDVINDGTSVSCHKKLNLSRYSWLACGSFRSSTILRLESVRFACASERCSSYVNLIFINEGYSSSSFTLSTCFELWKGRAKWRVTMILR